jgi:hypothetical protein
MQLNAKGRLQSGNGSRQSDAAPGWIRFDYLQAMSLCEIADLIQVSGIGSIARGELVRSEV